MIAAATKITVTLEPKLYIALAVMVLAIFLIGYVWGHGR